MSVLHWLYKCTTLCVTIMTVQYRANKYFKELEETDIGEDYHFGESNLQEVYKASRS